MGCAIDVSEFSEEQQKSWKNSEGLCILIAVFRGASFAALIPTDGVFCFLWHSFDGVERIIMHEHALRGWGFGLDGPPWGEVLLIQ